MEIETGHSLRAGGHVWGVGHTDLCGAAAWPCHHPQWSTTCKATTGASSRWAWAQRDKRHGGETSFVIPATAADCHLQQSKLFISSKSLNLIDWSFQGKGGMGGWCAVPAALLCCEVKTGRRGVMVRQLRTLRNRDTEIRMSMMSHRSLSLCRTDQLSQAKITPVPSPTARGCHDR